MHSVSGSRANPVVVTTYGTGERKAKINARNFLNGMLLDNCSFIKLTNIQISANGGTPALGTEQKPAMRCGVLVKCSNPGVYSGIHLDNLSVSDVFYENKGYLRGQDEVNTANGSQSYGWGIRFINENKGAVLSDVSVENCKVKNVSHTGIKLTAYDGGITNITLRNDSVLYTGGPGMQMSGVINGLVDHNFISHSGSNDDSRKWGRGSGLWTWSSSGIIIQHNRFLYANGPGDSAGCHIDFNCSDVVVQYNLSAHNAGGFCEILGNNKNCAYRYNISVDDGYRVKGENGAFQEGKLFWLSGYVGNRKPHKGPFNTYFYNNTMYVSKDIVSKIAIAGSASGILIMNNIFCLEGKSQLVEGDQNKHIEDKSGRDKRVVFKNNLYLNQSNWPADIPFIDQNPLFGSPGFVHPNGMSVDDYVPTHQQLIKNKGMEIPYIPGDTIGLKPGLKMTYDIRGHIIKGKPGLGAIQL